MSSIFSEQSNMRHWPESYSHAEGTEQLFQEAFNPDQPDRVVASPKPKNWKSLRAYCFDNPLYMSRASVAASLVS